MKDAVAVVHWGNIQEGSPVPWERSISSGGWNIFILSPTFVASPKLGLKAFQYLTELLMAILAKFMVTIS